MKDASEVLGLRVPAVPALVLASGPSSSLDAPSSVFGASMNAALAAACQAQAPPPMSKQQHHTQPSNLLSKDIQM